MPRSGDGSIGLLGNLLRRRCPSPKVSQRQRAWPRLPTSKITAVLEPVVDKAAVLVSDGAHAYRAFADHAGIAHIALNFTAGQRTWGIYHIQNVNNYGSRLKGWMRRFNGVATKYLDSYLGWHRTDVRQAGAQNANLMLAAAWG